MRFLLSSCLGPAVASAWNGSTQILFPHFAISEKGNRAVKWTYFPGESLLLQLISETVCSHQLILVPVLQRRLGPQRESVSAGAGLHGSPWMQTAAFPTSFLCPYCFPGAWTPGPDSSGEKSLIQIPKSPAVNHSHWSCPWMFPGGQSRSGPWGWAPLCCTQNFLPSRTWRGYFYFPGMPF